MSNTKTAPAEKKSGGAKKWLVRIGVGLACALFAIGLLVIIGYGYIRYLGIVMAAVSALGMHEVLGVSGCKNRTMTHIMMTFAAILPMYYTFGVNKWLEAKISGASGMIAIAYILITLMLMLKMYSVTRFEHMAIGLFLSFGIPLSVLSLYFLYEYMEACGVYTRAQVVVTLLLAMYAAWLTDTCALFVGSAMGKHKMAPNISPKKSVEGAVGGALGTTVISMISYFIAWKFYFPADAVIKWWMVLIIVPCVCVFGMCGDLAASVIKRNYGVKDFGTLLPEHGGILDRIDSFIFAMPATYLIVRLLTEIFA